MFYLKPPRHISTLPTASFWSPTDDFRSSPGNGHRQRHLDRLLNRQVGRLFTLEYSAGATNRHMIETLKAWCLVRAWVSVQ